MTAKKPKATPPAEKPNPAHLLIDGRFVTDGDRERIKAADTEAAKDAIYDDVQARVMSQPEVRAAAIIQEYQGDSLNVNALVNALREQVEEVRRGDMKRPEAMLVSQAHALDSLFCTLARRSHSNSNAGYTDAAERYLRLALKAQAQAVKTIEALAELKNPRPVTFVRQANVAHNQQVNNHPSQAGENQKAAEQTISGAGYELLPDSRASSLEGATYPPVATLAAIDRAEVTRGQGQGV